jgi:DNA polymerase-3 subunit epsilon
VAIIPGQLDLLVEVPRPAGAGPTLSDRLCALLVRRGRPLEVGQVASQLLRLRRCPEALQRRLVAEVVEGDARLAWLGRDLVGLAPPDWASRALAEATFCVVDLETTGGQPGISKITEIGAVRVRGLVVTERFQSLVDPGRPIPEAITRLTGIDDALVAGMPGVEEVLTAFVAFAGDDVLVAHNAPFDLRFLNHERRRLLGTHFTQPWLDTLTLARRLLPGRVARNDLGTLAEWADTEVRPRHRALPDAEATGELLVRFIGMLAEEGVTTLDRAVALGAPGGTRHSWKLALADDLPAVPGVYLMRDRRGEVLYVGKARDIRRRVRSYFGPGGRHGRLIGRALEQLERIDHERCATELDALLTESRLLRELRPPCNRRGLDAVTRHLVLTAERYPRLRVHGGAPPAGAGYLAPAGSERIARRAVELLEVLYPVRACHPLCAPGAASLSSAPRPCAGPCAGGDPAAHAAVVAEVRALFSASPQAALGVLGARMAQATAAGRWAPGDEASEGLQALVGLMRAAWRATAAGRRLAVVAEPATAGHAVLFAVAGGALVGRAEVTADRWEPAASLLLDALPAAAGPPVAGPADPEAQIIDARIRDRGAPFAVVLEDGWDRAAVTRAVAEAVSAACGERRRRPAAPRARAGAGT